MISFVRIKSQLQWPDWISQCTSPVAGYGHANLALQLMRYRIALVGVLIEWIVAWISSRMDFSICEDADGSLKSEDSCCLYSGDL
jgi:hypothetical protein